VFEQSSHSIRSDEPQAMMDAIVGFMVYRRP
jgi:proline iminopeptidase